MKTCIQCGCEINFLNDDLTLYQVNKDRYLYCAGCQNPRETYTSPSQIKEAELRIKALESTIKRLRQGKLAIFLIGIAIGWFIHSL